MAEDIVRDADLINGSCPVSLLGNPARISSAGFLDVKCGGRTATGA